MVVFHCQKNTSTSINQWPENKGFLSYCLWVDNMSRSLANLISLAGILGVGTDGRNGPKNTPGFLPLLLSPSAVESNGKEKLIICWFFGSMYLSLCGIGEFNCRNCAWILLPDTGTKRDTPTAISFLASAERFITLLHCKSN